MKDLDAAFRAKYIVFFNHNASVLWRSGNYKQNILFGSGWDIPPVGDVQLQHKPVAVC